MNRAFAIAMLAMNLVPGAGAMAGERYETRRIAVPAEGLDLSSDAGIDILAARIDRAIDRICGVDRACRDGAWDSTEVQVDRLVHAARDWRALAAQLSACRDRGTRPAIWYSPAATTTVIIIRD